MHRHVGFPVSGNATQLAAFKPCPALGTHLTSRSCPRTGVCTVQISHRTTPAAGRKAGSQRGAQASRKTGGQYVLECNLLGRKVLSMAPRVLLQGQQQRAKARDSLRQGSPRQLPTHQMSRCLPSRCSVLPAASQGQPEDREGDRQKQVEQPRMCRCRKMLAAVCQQGSLSS